MPVRPRVVMTTWVDGRVSGGAPARIEPRAVASGPSAVESEGECGELSSRGSVQDAMHPSASGTGPRKRVAAAQDHLNPISSRSSEGESDKLVENDRDLEDEWFNQVPKALLTKTAQVKTKRR